MGVAKMENPVSEVIMWNKLLLLLLFSISSGVAFAEESFTKGSTLTEDDNKLNILMLGDPTRSHLATILAVGEELAHRGHNVTLLMIVYENEQELYRTLVEKHRVKLWNISAENLVKLDMTTASKLQSKTWVFTQLRTVHQHIGLMQEIMFQQANTSLATDNWDIVVGNDAMIIVMSCLQSFYDLPFVLVGMHLDIGAHLHPQWPWPGFIQGAASDNMLFTDRFASNLYQLLHRVLLHVTFSVVENCPLSLSQALSTFGHRNPNIMPTAIGFQYPVTISPLTDYVGALVTKYPDPLTGEIGEWLANKSDKSVVYVSMGSLFHIDKEGGRSFLEGVMNTNYSLLWSLSNQWILEGLDVDPDRVLVSDWTPQFSVLGSEAIHSAILHAGFNGLSEALWNGVPVIVIPQILEQEYNAGRVHHNGLGIHLDAVSLSSSKITESIKALDTGEYRAKVARLQKVMRMAGGVERAADLIEFYADIGYSHLVPAYAKYQWSWVQYYNADVYALMLLILAIVIMCLKTCCKYVCKSFCSRTDKKKKD